MEEGILYVATRDNYRAECRLSAERVKRVMPDTPITVFSDEPIESESIDRCEIIPDPSHGSGDAIRHLPRSPYDKTIYFDTDTYLAEGIDDVFEMLSHFDLGVVIDPLHSESRHAPLPEIPENFPLYNTGVIAYRLNDRTHTFLSDWLRLFDARPDIEIDQPSFRDAVYRSDLRLLTLPPEYNCLFGVYPGYLNGSVKVFHGRLISEGEFKGLKFKYDPEEIRERLNRSHRPRVYTHSRGFEVIVDDTAEVALPTRVWYSIQRDGIKGTVRNINAYIR